MKKVIATFIIIALITSCNSVKNMNTSSMSDAATLLSSLSSNSTVQQVASLFSLLDTNNDQAISSTEAIGEVSENFDVLDTDNNASLNLTELEGILGLLK
ncbi:hypothetical protein [Maribacter sp. 1_2014MBL_MicDiv]|uniref:hypothetical protein n=1 Tax=Maribacter sp. 1_2014MBL_MicDiv TaxID=1644130 RepID=UPI0008F49124|nr:hypothetical protein [Maribacter sp. 1_2014MBL_MicDiv]APA66010.1 hypothetical protein YQ22_17860 [Maribacter sp. 1_2014MBL_MicDiv]